MSFDRADMAAWFEARGEKPFRAQQVLKWIHQQGVEEFDAMTNLSKALREELKTVAEIRGLTIVADQSSADGSRKWFAPNRGLYQRVESRDRIAEATHLPCNVTTFL